MAEFQPIRFRRLTLIRALCALLLAGCNTKLSAPPLDDAPVYKNQREGFRFFVPAGWKQRAKGEVPPGKIETERMLVEYRCMTCAGTLMVTVADVPLTTSLSDYISANTKTGEEWHMQSPPEEFTINAMPAVRVSYVEGEGRLQMVREIVAFRREERVYFFKSFYASEEAESRKALRAAVDTIVW